MPFWLNGALLEHFDRAFCGQFPVLDCACASGVFFPLPTTKSPCAQALTQRLLDLGYRAKVDDRAEKVNRKIGIGAKKVPFALVIGKKK